MRRYHHLRDNMLIVGRWHLGEVRTSAGFEPELTSGISFRHEGPLMVEVTRPGLMLDFSLTSFGVPVATAALSCVVAMAAGVDVECLPLGISGQTGMMALNAVRVIRCIDEARSEFIKWTAQDHRADLAGQYRQVTRLVIDPLLVPDDAHFFRLEGWLVGLIVSDAVKAAMERAGCLGAKFVDVFPPD
jgi:hypothetical protein